MKRILTGVAIGAVALVAGVISYTHVYGLSLALHQSAAVACLVPFGIDGLIVVGSVVLLDGNRLGWLGVGPGVAISLFANAMSGLAFGWLAETGLAGDLPGNAVPESERSRVSLRVLPFAAGAHAVAGCGPTTLLRFAEAPEIGVVHLSTLSGGISLERRDEVARYLRSFAGLRSAALPASRSAQLIRAVARSYDR